jgi:plastocyanin
MKRRAAACAIAVLLPLPAVWPGGSAGARATGAIEGTVTVPPAVKTADRYVSTSGEPRDIQSIPAVVYIEGAVASNRPAPRAGAAQLTQKGEAFSPSLLTVPAGTAVAFPNGDPFFHNVFSYSRAKRFDLGRYRQGESKTVVFDRPGYVKVMCEVHKWMRAGVLVVENPYYAIVAESGRFRIDNVPPGRYRVTVEHFDRRQQVEVEVPQGGSATISVKL